jgi:hypothetical protein
MKKIFGQFGAGVGVLAMAIIAGGWLLDAGIERNRSAERLAEIIALVSERHVDDVDEARLYEMAIEGMVAQLASHSRLIRPDDFEEFRRQTLGAYAVSARRWLCGDRG